MEVIFTEQEMNQYRPVLGIFGKLYGRKVACPKSENLELDFKEKERNDVNPRFAKPIKKYFVQTVDLIDFKLTKNANGKAVIMINNDKDLIYPLVPNETPKICDCDLEKITAAILKYEETKEVSFFTDISAVADHVQSLNEQNAQDIENFCDKLMTQISSLRTLNKTIKHSCDSYYNSIKD